MDPASIIPAFDSYLARRDLRLNAVVIGGSALVLLGIVHRATRDCDVMHPPLPDDIGAAARDFAAESRSRGVPLDDDWLNDKPGPLADNLPSGWEARLQPAFEGKALTLQSLGRLDLLRSKLFALCDRGIDLPDCVSLGPTRDELEQIRPWLDKQDGNPSWPEHVKTTLEDLTSRMQTAAEKGE